MKIKLIKSIGLLVVIGLLLLSTLGLYVPEDPPIKGDNTKNIIQVV